ncbi:MAG: class II aldolase/adducin family protein [Acidiferrobacterales bacterium]|nr:class II aldolase/adducin family protein [Acidiferrobacterales bacterium]
MKSQKISDNVVTGKWSTVSTEEWQTRVDLAACHRLAELNGFSDIVWNHISARVPGQPNRFLINLFGLRFDEVTASNLVTLDENGQVAVPPTDANGEIIDTSDSNFTGFVIHSAIYNEREDVNCIMHSHSRAALAVSALKEGFMPLVQDAFQFYNRVSYHDYEGLSLDLDERERLAASLSDNPVMIMRNHGLLTTGDTVAQAYMRMYYLELSCRVQMDVLAMGREIHLPPGDVCEHAAKQYQTAAPCGTYEWPALLRQLDSIDRSYRD